MPNHVLAVPDPNVTIARKCRMVPIEAVVRGYLTGVTDTAIWTRYGKGQRDFGGLKLPDAMRKNQKLPQPIFDPTTKEAAHDRTLSPEQMIAEGFVSKELFARIKATALALFACGQEIAARRGLASGRHQIRIRHRPAGRAGSHRRNPYAGFLALLAARFLCRAFCRRPGAGLFRQGVPAAVVSATTATLMPMQELPDAPQELVDELSRRYIRMFEQITGNKFQPVRHPDPAAHRTQSAGVRRISDAHGVMTPPADSESPKKKNGATAASQNWL